MEQGIDDFGSPSRLSMAKILYNSNRVKQILPQPRLKRHNHKSGTRDSTLESLQKPLAYHSFYHRKRGPPLGIPPHGSSLSVCLSVVVLQAIHLSPLVCLTSKDDTPIKEVCPFKHQNSARSTISILFRFGVWCVLIQNRASRLQ